MTDIKDTPPLYGVRCEHDSVLRGKMISQNHAFFGGKIDWGVQRGFSKSCWFSKGTLVQGGGGGGGEEGLSEGLHYLGPSQRIGNGTSQH